jgi:hypothetical protein
MGLIRNEMGEIAIAVCEAAIWMASSPIQSGTPEEK